MVDLKTKQPHETEDQTLLGRFFLHTNSNPDKLTISKVSVHGNTFNPLGISYRDLAVRAKRYAHTLKKNYSLRENDRIILCVSDPHSFLSCTLGAMLGGFVIVPLPTFSSFGVPEEFIKRIQLVLEDCQPRLIIIENPTLWNRHMQNIDLNVPIVEVGELHLRSNDEPIEDAFSIPPFLLCDVAFIQYTSGSTGNPKGVMITHKNLAANLYYMGTVSNINPQKDSLLSWLPLYHDMGLVGNLFFPLYWNIPSYVFTPLSFVARPATWIRAISHFKATYSVAPTFAYNVAYKKISDRELEGIDLTNWRLAFIGAEPIDVDTTRGFIQRFSKYGFKATSFYPVYGMAEATLALAFPPCGREPLLDIIDRQKLAEDGYAAPASAAAPHTITFVSVGFILPKHTLKIVHQKTYETLPERHVGEIVVNGPSVSPYYFSKKEFKPERRTELRTGDLGYIANGELYIVGRLKDLIIVAGQNFIPSDLEHQLSTIPGLRTGRIVAFSTPNQEGTESLQIMAEIKINFWREQEKIRSRITEVINAKFGLQVERVILRIPGSLPKTSSGKVKRSACREEVLNQEISQTIGPLTVLRLKLASLWQKFLLSFSSPL